MAISKTNGGQEPQPQIVTRQHYITGEDLNYTKVKVKDKDSGKSFIINFKNAKVTGNQAEWTIKDGLVYDKNGKTIQDNEMEVTRYQAALIQAAAGNSEKDDTFMDDYDLIGAGYADNAEKALQENKSQYKLDTFEITSGTEREQIKSADATEAGVIYADVVNKDNDEEKGHLTIDMRTPEQLDARAKEEAQYQEFLKNTQEQPSLFRRIFNFLAR